MSWLLYPSTRTARLHHTIDANEVGGVAKRQPAVFSHVMHRSKRGRERCVQLFEQLIAAPVLVGCSLHLLEVAARHAASIGQDIGDEKNTTIVERGVGSWRRRPVGPFRHNL